MGNNFSWNLCSDFIAHAGRAHDENPPGRGSGRYPWGSGAKNGKTPIHEHGEKKHKTSGDRVNKRNDKTSSYEFTALKPPTQPLTKVVTTGGLFNKRKETVLTEAGKKWQSNVAEKTKSYYDNMDEKDIDARKKAFDKWKKAREEYEEEPSAQTYQKEANASDALHELVMNDGNKILGTGHVLGDIKPGDNLYGNYKDNHEAYILGWNTFNNTYMDILNNRDTIQHSDMYDNSFYSVLLEVFNMPI